MDVGLAGIYHIQNVRICSDLLLEVAGKDTEKHKTEGVMVL